MVNSRLALLIALALVVDQSELVSKLLELRDNQVPPEDLVDQSKVLGRQPEINNIFCYEQRQDILMKGLISQSKANQTNLLAVNQ